MLPAPLHSEGLLSQLLVMSLNDSSAFSPFWKLLLWREFPCPSSSPLLRADHFHWLIGTWVRGWPSLDSDKPNGPFQHHLMFQGHLRHYYDFIPTQLLPSSLFCFILHKWWLQEHSLISFFLANLHYAAYLPWKPLQPGTVQHVGKRTDIEIRHAYFNPSSAPISQLGQPKS